MNLLTDANPWDEEDCAACADRGDWPCDFHQGMDFGYWVAIQVAHLSMNDDVPPHILKQIVESYPPSDTTPREDRP